MRTATLLIAGFLVATVAPSVRGESTIDYATQIEPIFKDHCYSCHGESKGLGRVRLHTAEAIAESSEAHSDLLTAGKPDESELYERLVLPADNPKRMPKGGDPLSEKQIALVKQWITEGASYTSAAATEPAAEMATPAAPVERPEVSAATPEAIAAAEATGALVLPLYASSNELRVSFPSTRDQVSDETVAALLPLAPQIVELDLSGTAITDGCCESLEKFTNVDTLHLEKTAISDAAIPSLAAMQYLNYLNLHSTQVTDQAIKSLKSIPSLRKLYLWQTHVSYEATKGLEQAIPGLKVNLGWNHPGVVRERLNAELTRVEKQVADSAAAITEAEQALQAAKTENQAASERAAEIKKELEAIAKPATEGTPTQAP
ncbi:c-type cytochrome domain-containing protein [Aeoliella mucimassa]|uniref:Planctomycete cytochrome C n=1 Tax=Aeoliella mucimassa TaxID=2527972 RepID=A0A518AIM4_9BACT|nr:c-type cytochrome domain-containing protein [Aeoliella mucimassa]QDU54589.1 Planctomycete cytochrome C [Aeoliella mucimassa]